MNNQDLIRENYNKLFPVLQEVVIKLNWFKEWSNNDFVNRASFCQQWLELFCSEHSENIPLKSFNCKLELKKYIQAKRNFIKEEDWNYSLTVSKQEFEKENHVSNSQINNDPEAKEDEKDYIEIKDNSFIESVFSNFLNKTQYSDDDKIEIFESYNDQLNDNSFYSVANKPPLPCWRTFKYFFAKNHILFATSSDVERYRSDSNKKNDLLPNSTIQSDCMTFERECRKIGINNETSIWNLYFNLKEDDIKNNRMQCHDEYQIRSFLDLNSNQFKKYEVNPYFKNKKKEKKVNRTINLRSFLNN